MSAIQPDDRALAEALGALASPQRLALLREIRVPKALREIVVPADDGRPLARQTVASHLDWLLAPHLVERRDAEGPGNVSVEYVVNHQTIYSLSESLRALARLRPTVEPDAPTMDARAAPLAREPGVAHLLLVKGLDEGASFPLVPQGRARWVIGRRRGEILLDYDAAVSAENTLLSYDGHGYRVEDLPESRNGTLLNFRPLHKGRPEPLAHGDLLTLGQTSLLFREGLR